MTANFSYRGKMD